MLTLSRPMEFWTILRGTCSSVFFLFLLMIPPISLAGELALQSPSAQPRHKCRETRSSFHGKRLAVPSAPQAL